MKKLLFLIGILFALPHISFAAIAFKGGMISLGVGGAGTSETIAFNASGTNPFMVCADMNYTTNPNSINMTYAGTQMTTTSPSNLTNGGAVPFSNVFYLAAPPTGSNNLVVKTNTSVSHNVWCGIFTGVDQTNPVDATTTKTTSVAALSDSLNITTATDQDAIITVTVSGNGREHKGGSGNGSIYGDGTLGTPGLGAVGGLMISGSGFYAASSPPGTISVTQQSIGTFTSNVTNESGNDVWNIYDIAIKPVATATVIPTQTSNTILSNGTAIILGGKTFIP